MLRAEFVNPFVSAAFKVLEMEVKAHPKKGTISIEESALTTNDVTVLIAVVGDVRGMVMYSMSERTAKAIVSAMINAPVPIFDSLAESGVSEIGNMITGQASVEMERNGYSCRISPPTVIIGRGTLIFTVDIKRLVIPIEIEYGSIQISVALEENHSAAGSAKGAGS